MFVDDTRIRGKDYFSIRVVLQIRVVAALFTLRSIMRNCRSAHEIDIINLAETAEKHLILAGVRDEIVDFGIRDTAARVDKWGLRGLVDEVERIFVRRFDRDSTTEKGASKRSVATQLIVIQGGLDSSVKIIHD